MGKPGQELKCQRGKKARAEPSFTQGDSEPRQLGVCIPKFVN